MLQPLLERRGLGVTTAREDEADAVAEPATTLELRQASKRTVKIVVTHTIPGPAVEMLEARGHDVTVGPVEPHARKELTRLLAGAEAVITLHYDDVDANFFDAAGDGLKLVANYGVGVEHIDVEAAKRRGIKLAYTPDVLNQAVAEHTLAPMLAVARRIAESDRFVRARTDEYWHANLLLGTELKGRIFDPVTDSWSSFVSLNQARDNHTAT